MGGKGRLAKKKLMGGSCLDLIMNLCGVGWMGGYVPVIGSSLTISLGQALGFLCFIYRFFYTIFFSSLLSCSYIIVFLFLHYTCLSFDELLRGDLIVWSFLLDQQIITIEQ